MKSVFTTDGRRPAHSATVGVQACTTRKPAAPGQAVRPHRAPTMDAQLTSVSLRHVSDAGRGYTRERRGDRITYRNVSGHAIHDAVTIARIEALAIPPAWVAVWISPSANGHMQATGRDAKGRKQYRYHARWLAVRSETKFDRMREFGAALPEIRARVAADMARDKPSRNKVLAVIVRLLETTYIRVGNEEYARTNGSYGLTTLRNRHARFVGDTLRLEFIGKMGKAHSMRITDRRMARLIRQFRDLPGQALFQYRDDGGKLAAIESGDVNAYIHDISGSEFTAKDFRTWAGSLLAASQIAAAAVDEEVTLRERASATADAIAHVAAQLGNTPAVCKAGYIHPRVLAALGQAEAEHAWQRALRDSRAKTGLTREESALLSFLGSD